MSLAAAVALGLSVPLPWFLTWRGWRTGVNVEVTELLEMDSAPRLLEGTTVGVIVSVLAVLLLLSWPRRIPAFLVGVFSLSVVAASGLKFWFDADGRIFSLLPGGYLVIAGGVLAIVSSIRRRKRAT